MFKLAYCDKIADTIQKALKQPDPDGIIADVSKINWDLDPVGGYLVSTKKLITVYDRNGKAYSVIIEEQPAMDLDFSEEIGKEVVDNEYR